MLADILQPVDREDLAALVLLDLSAAFDTYFNVIFNRPNYDFDCSSRRLYK